MSEGAVLPEPLERVLVSVEPGTLLGGMPMDLEDRESESAEVTLWATLAPVLGSGALGRVWVEMLLLGSPEPVMVREARGSVLEEAAPSATLEEPTEQVGLALVSVEITFFLVPQELVTERVEQELPSQEAAHWVPLATA